MQLCLETISGSHAYGLAVEGSDTDVRGIYFPDPATSWGVIHQSLPARADDRAVDASYWEAALFAKKAMQGVPGALELLWAPIRSCDVFGEALRAQRALFLSTALATPVHGWMESELRRVSTTGWAGITQSGWKSLMHVVRMGLVGVHTLRTGEYLVDMTPQRDALLAIRAGEYGITETYQWIESLRAEMRVAAASSPLPREPNVYAIHALMIDLRARWTHQWLHDHGYGESTGG
jgi:hypothetical protein